MASTSSSRSFARFARLAVAAAFAIGASVGIRDDGAYACAGWEPSIAELTTFDPRVVNDLWAGLEFDPFVAGFGGSCEGDCATKVMVADWHGYLKEAVTDKDWEQVLLKATLGDLAMIVAKIAGKANSAPKGYEKSSLWSAGAGAAKDRLLDALAYVQLARAVEGAASFETYDPKTAKPGATLASEQGRASKGLADAKDPFLKQRYAFLAVKIAFYKRDWAAVVKTFDKNAATLAAPSQDLHYRARYYVAGALRRTKEFARANLELARIHGNYTPLAGAAAQDFHPKEEGDWRESLRLAKDTRERTELWRVVGMKTDGLVAMQEILKLDPKSTLVPLLMVRELARVESMSGNVYGGTPDPKELAAQKKAYTALEQLAVRLANAPGTDRPWVMDLVAGHIAARRGDLLNARPRLAHAVQVRPGDRRVASQAKASLAVALVQSWKITPANEDELAITMRTLDPDYARLMSVRDEVRGKLAVAYLAAGRIVDAEFLKPGTVDPVDAMTGRRTAKGKPRWEDVAFIKEMIGRYSKSSSEFDRFVLASSHTRARLEQDLALRYVLDGDFATAAKAFHTTSAVSELLKTDPFAIHVVDCHDCDHEKLGPSSKWTHANLVDRLVELELKAKGAGEPAAEAALALGNALYNITWYGNARTFLEASHQPSRDATAAGRWYKRAFDLTKNRELKAKAAFLAAKADLGNAITLAEQQENPQLDPLPISRTWFPIVKSYADTKYYKEVLKECGRFREWVQTGK